MQKTLQIAASPQKNGKRYLFGYFLVASILASALINKGNFLNPVTIFLQVAAYIYWSFLIACIHSNVTRKDSSYPFGPKESMVGALIPFAYIFWNWCWSQEVCKWSGLSKKRGFLLGALTALASVIAYPDNLHKCPGILSTCAFAFLFFQVTYLNSRLNKYTDQATEITSPIVRNKAYFKNESKIWLSMALFGCIYGLIAPGFDQWYLAWFGLVPIIISAFTSKNPPQAFYRAVFFGFSYNLVYSLFILQFNAQVWPESLRPYATVANTVVWLLFSLQQAALFGTFCFISRWLPLSRLKLPATLVLPVLWVLIFNKLGNHLSSLSMPWSLIEYSQYQQTYLIQCASIIGGIGIASIIVMSNVVIARFIATLSIKPVLKELSFASRSSMIASAITLQIFIAGALLFGIQHLQSSTACNTRHEKEIFSVLQGNMMFGFNQIDPKVFFNCYLNLAKSSPPGVCVWPEWSMPISITKNPDIFEDMAKKAKANKQDWLVGAIDSDNNQNSDEDQNFYNAAIMLGKSSKAEKEIYHKQYLVPFGEYSPTWLLNSPLGGLCGTLTPKRKGYVPGTKSVVFTSGKNKIAPLICCELLSPELASKAVRQGGEVLVDCSNTMWFQTKLLGDQSFAVCTMRAVENHRYFVFGTSIGPSAFIDWHGHILKSAPMSESISLSQEVNFDSKLTPFTTWFR